MKKLASTIVALFGVIILSANCFAEIKKVPKTVDTKVVKDIAQQIIQRNELSSECVKSAKGDAKKLISVKSIQLGDENSDRQGFEVRSNSRTCCKGEASCPTWVYIKDESFLVKIFGPEFSKELIFSNNHSTNSLRDMTVIYVGGNHAIRTEELYISNGEKYVPSNAVKNDN